MFLRSSRYFGARRFEPAPDGQAPFKGVRPRDIGAATPVLEHALQPGERLDALGVHYYNDARRWWRILDANPDVLCTAQLEMIGQRPLPPQPPLAAGEDAQDLGEVVLIPRATEAQP